MVIKCHVKLGDKVIVLCGSYAKTIATISKVVRCKKESGRFDTYFKVALSTIPKKSVRIKMTKSIVQRDVLIDSSNVLLISRKESEVRS